MALKKFRPTSPGRRFRTSLRFEELTTDQPHRPLLESKKRSSGRNNRGRITIWQRGGGHKRHYRIIDFKRNKIGIPARVATVDTLAFVIVTGMLWWRGGWSITGRAYCTIVALAALTLIPWMRYWHVL